jgi:hypothetical protein
MSVRVALISSLWLLLPFPPDLPVPVRENGLTHGVYLLSPERIHVVCDLCLLSPLVKLFGPASRLKDK